MKGFKVFKVGPRGVLRSFLALGKSKVNYRKGRYNGSPRWLSKKKYFLTFFPNEDDARSFAFSEGIKNYQIWKVDCLKVIKWAIPPKLELDSIRRGHIGRFSNSWPCGTEMAKKIKPVKMLKR